MRQEKRLSALAVSRAKQPGMYPDGLGLYLRVGPSGTKSWIFRYRQGDRRHDMGLGPLHTLGLSDARVKAEACRKQRLDGLDPLKQLRDQQMVQKLEAAKGMSFRDCADSYIKAHEAGWKNPSHRSQWRSTLEMYAYPVLGDLPVHEIDTSLVMKVIEPIWSTRTETASRLRGRIEAILDWAAVREFRRGDNPARWKGHLQKLLPARSSLSDVVHHPALPYAEIKDFMMKLRAENVTASNAMEFLILTATRTNEVIGAKWSEIDMENRLWIVPKERMRKTGREHRVPLSTSAMAILEKMKGTDDGDFVFPGRKQKPMSNMALLVLLKRMGRKDLTTHGFRSTFRDWVAEQTDYPNEVAEMALSHTVGDKVEAAYRRGDLFEKRRSLMQDWAGYCG